MLTLVTLDVLFASCIVTPLVIIFWWFTWEIFQRHALIFPLWWQLSISIILLIATTIARDPLTELPHKGWIYAIFRRIYIYINGIIGIGIWRCEWVLMEKHFSFETTFLTLIISLIFFVVVKCLSTLQSSPMAIALDHDPVDVFSFPAMFKLTRGLLREGIAGTWLIFTACLRMRGSTAGISDGLKGSSRAHYIFLTTLDHVISSILISPLVIGYWRGTWCFMDYFVYPKEPRYSSAVSLAIGYIGTMIFTLTQKCHRQLLHPDERWLSYYLVSRVYTACFGFICVNSWRGVWMALDVYTSVDSKTIASITLLSVFLLTVSRTLRNISASPFTIMTDRYEGYFDVPTLLNSSSDNLWMYILDCTFSVCVVGTLVVFVWRGSWCLLDIFLYPGNPAVSAWASLGIGYILVVITFGLQPTIKYLAKVLSGISRILVVDIYLLFAFGGTINVWRGIWNLLNVYFLPDLPAFSYFLTHSISFLLLILINSSNSILVRGVYVDGHGDGEQCVDFPCYYIRLFFQARQKKKLLQKSEKRQKGRRKSDAAESLIQIDPSGKPTIVVINHSEPATNEV